MRTRLCSFSPQLFKIRDGIPKGYASSVLVNCGINKFLVSAAHILEEVGTNPIHIDIGHLFYRLPNNWHSLQNIKLDLTVLPITGEFEKILCQHYEFYDIGIINPDHSISIEQKFFALGYPSSKTKLKNSINRFERGIYAHIFELQSHETCFDLGFHPNTHLVFDASKKVQLFDQNNRGQLPDQPGMSGCGIWHIPQVNQFSDQVSLLLSGIYIEYHQKNGKHSIVATRLNVLTEFLRIQFDCKLVQTKCFNLSIN